MFYLFAAILDEQLCWLLFVVGLNSVIRLYYYIKVVKAMFLTSPDEGADTSPLKLHWLQNMVMAMLAISTLALGWSCFL